MKSRADRSGITRCALFGPLALATLALVPAQATAQARAEAVAKAPAPSLDRLNEDLRALSERVAPSVVQIMASGYSATSATGSVGAIKREQASGSGLAWTADGHIVTNAHVVEGAAAIQVLLRPAPTFREGGSILGPRSLRVPGRLVGLDRESDVAVIKVEGQTLAPLELGDSQDLKQGQVVLAFGSPLGLENSMSLGVVSAVARQLKPEDPMIYIQTDAAINPGNSGGPLVDTKGRLVGLNTMILTQSGGNEGIGFAIPSHILTTVANQLVRTGRVHRGWISARAQTVTPTLARGLGLPQDYGVILSDVVPGGPAARAGLRIGDIVLTLDRRPMENARQLEVNLYRFAVGETVTLEVRRGLATFTALVTIVERLEDPDRFAGLVTPERNLIPKLGVLGIEIDSDLRKLLPTLRGEAGVVVASRATFAPSDGPEPGDVIYAVNGVSVRGLSELRAAMDDLRKGDPVVLHVERDSRLRYVALEIE